MPNSQRTALYRLYNAEGNLLYIGISSDPSRRFRDHRSRHSWWGEVTNHSLEWFEIEFHALLAEVRAISTEAPRYNVRSTSRWKAQQSEAAKRISPEAKRRRGVGRAARAIQERVYRELRDAGTPRDQAACQALQARQAHKEASGLFD